MPSRLRLRTLGLLALSAAVLGTAAPSAAGAASGFDFGVAAGDVSSRSAILWARANRSGPALIQIGRDRRFGPCNLGRAPARLRAGAAEANDNTVQKRVGGLRPDTTYHYRFCMRGGARSSAGSFETAPAPNQAKTIRFAMSGDQDALPRPGQSRPFWNRFQVWNLIRRQRNDFNVLLGDTIYSDTEVPGYGLANVATTVPQKWAKYRINLGQDPWANARGSAAYYAHWDDHEFINDFSPLANEFPLGVGTVRVNGRALYQRSVKAFRNYNPITYSGQNGIYRSFRWGKNLEIFFLDERSFRSRLADYQGNCDNPPGSGERDLAPTAPQSTRNLFSAIVPQLANPVPPQCTQAINDPDRTLLGDRQLRRFKNAIRRSTATFKVIFNELPIQQYYIDPYDRWEGYAAERQNLLRFLADNVDNVVFLAADVHANLVNDVRFQTLEEGGPGQLRDHRDRHRPDRDRYLCAGDQPRDRERELRGAGPRRLPQASASERGRDAVRGDRPIQLRPGHGDPEPASGAAAGHRQRQGQGYRRPSERRSGARLRALRLQPRVEGSNPAKRR